MEKDTVWIIGTLVSWAALLAGIVGSYWKLKMADQAQEMKAKELEKEFIKELNDVDDKMERVFEAQKKLITIDKHKDLDRITKMEIKEEIRNATDELGKKVKDDLEKTMTDFAEKFGKMFEDVQKAINGKD